MAQLTLLIVDDDPLVREMLIDTLRPSYRVLAAADGLEALQALEREPVDVVLSDHYMPGMPGAELLAHVAARWPETLRILFTAAPDATIAIRAVNLGQVYRILVKPLDVPELQMVLHSASMRLRVEREHWVLRAMLEASPELEARFAAEIAQRWPALAEDHVSARLAEISGGPEA